VLDSTGAVLRTFMPDTTTPDSAAARSESRRRFGGGPWLPTGARVDHLTWDLRGEPFVTFPGMIFWGARAAGPALPPGRYTVRLSANGQTASAPLRIERNPWITGVSDADLRAQYAFSRAVRDEVDTANDAVIAIRRVKAQLADRYKSSSDAALHKAGDKLLADVSAVEADIYQVKNESGQDPLNFPIRVNNRLAVLMSMAERGDGRPTNHMPDIFEILKTELNGYTGRLDTIWTTDLVDVNAQLSRLGMAALSLR
jgi:hypothetical protein